MTEHVVRALKILGRDFSIKASPGEEMVLEQAIALLQKRVDENQQRFPLAGSHELLVLAALNLCVPLLEQEERLRQVEARLSATAERIARQLQG
ncbi:cell division protein ZapA [Pseudomonas oryzae]|uniref:Cell division protein ZapA, inhibits GTPase activity of FtsZ n=1 Tax=Pseudomonas oryzae TaxID=1392877 RepID=A0A1H1TTT5_9PSED|nr:cell division protein ZapA [Pseudomonas oryzae]SDS63610.1 Cell division protein ZapA, inhibits GTPase activity of FtsZ [Pseudomonas oryzae]